MVVEIIRYTIPADQAEAFETAYATAQAELRLSPHCVGFELSRCVEDPTAWILRIEWTSTEDHLQGFRRGPLFPSFLAKIRPFIGQIEEMRHYQVASIRSDASVFASAGGAEAFERLAAEMHRRMAADPLLGPWFRHASPTHVQRLGAWLGQVFGGPPRYTDDAGDIGDMLARHAGLEIPEDKRQRFVDCTAAAAAVIWPERPDLVEVVGRYVAWGSHVAVENSRRGHVPDATAGVPTWSWDSRG